MAASRRFARAVVSAALAAGCGSEPDASQAAGSSVPQRACEAGELLLGDGRCLAAGIQANGCPAGELGGEGGECRPAGVDPALCANGFEPDGVAGCRAVLPVDACPSGQMAVPGETACREVAPCGEGRWGDIPVGADTQYVDAAYAGGGSDGTEAKPWTSLEQGVGAAASGAIVAIAEGSYVEDLLVEGKQVRLWGRCPALVELVGTATQNAALFVRDAAGGSEVVGIAVRGAGAGILVSGSEDVRLDRLWIHDTADLGVSIQGEVGPTSATLSRSLVEAAATSGVLVSGASATVEATVIRDVTPSGDATYGWGALVQDNPTTHERSAATLRDSVIERNHDVGVFVLGSDATIEATLVRDTQPEASSGGDGWGVVLQNDPLLGQRSTGTIRSSVIERCRERSLVVTGSDAAVEALVVRDTLPQEVDGTAGRGVDVLVDPDTGERGVLDLRSSLIEASHEAGILVEGAAAAITSTIVRSTESQTSDGTAGYGIVVQVEPANGVGAQATLLACLVENNHDAGVFVGASEATIEGTIVQSTQPETVSLDFGRGLGVQHDPETGKRSAVTVRSSVFRANHDVGVFVASSDAILEGVIVTQTKIQASDGTGGRGINVQIGSDASETADLRVRGCVIDDNHDMGVYVAGATAVLETTLVRGTEAVGGVFGDGIGVFTWASGPSTVLRDVRIETSARAGLASFGASVAVGTTVIDCNRIDLDGEAFGTLSFDFDDLGGNSCGCGAATHACQVSTLGLAPPEPLQMVPGPPS